MQRKEEKNENTGVGVKNEVPPVKRGRVTLTLLLFAPL
jgi:hypothetical protein